MKHKYLHDALPFLKEVDRERQKQFEFYFRNAPLWVMDLLQSEELEPGTTFIRENEPAEQKPQITEFPELRMTL